MNDHAAPLEGLPVFGTSWDPAHLDFPADADFQTGIGDWILRGELEDPADALMGGHAAPRLWLLLHEPGEGRLAAVAALALARELMGRDQAVLVLDCDEEDALLSGWADRNEQEGWIDLVRYGASLLTCGVRLPFSGRQGLLLGPGSYRPVDAQPAEIEQLLARLRRQADDILLCCPIGESGRSWAGQADVRLLCWDSGRADGPQLESLAQGFARAGTPLTGIVRFGDEEIAGGGIAAPAAEEETADLDVEQAIEALEEQAAEEAESVDPAAEPSTPEPEPASTPEPEPAPTPERGPSPDFGEDVPGLQRPTGAEPDLYARKRGTSRVFWWIAAAAVVLIAGSFWYYREYVMVQPLDSEPRVARHEARPAEGTGGIDVATSTGPQDGAPVQPGAEEAAGQAGAQEGAAAGNDEQAEAPATTTSEPEATAPRGAEPTATESSAPLEPATNAETPTTRELAADEFYMDPYLVPVGEEGWALHVYSFPDSQSTAEELAILHRRGFQTAVRTVQIKDRGRWERIYLGSFPSREAAQEALAPLLKQLGEDWGRPTEF